MYHVAVLASHPIQYHAPLWRAIAARPEVELHVYYQSDHGVEPSPDADFGVTFAWDTPLLEGYESTFLQPTARVGGGFFSRRQTEILRYLRRGRYDVLIVHSYAFLTDWLAVLAARSVGTHALIRAVTSHVPHVGVQTRGLRAFIVRSFFRLLSGGLAAGTAMEDYYRHYGVPDERIFPCPYCVDHELFASQEATFRPQREAIRAAFGVSDDRPIILSCGKLIPRKQPSHLLEAYERVRSRYECALLFAGEGELRGEIEAAVRERRIPDVFITGFLNQSEIGKVYVAADIFCLPSRSETWGAVLNEAMNFGLPIVTTNAVSAGIDLVVEGRNGSVTPDDDVDALAEALEGLVADAGARRAFGGASREIIQSFSPERAAAALVAACERISGTTTTQ